MLARRDPYASEVRFPDLCRQLNGRMEPETRDHGLILWSEECHEVSKRGIRTQGWHLRWY